MEINVGKTKVMVLAKQPLAVTEVVLGGKPLKFVSTYKYVGIPFGSEARRGMFAGHYESMHKKAVAAAESTLSSGSMCGSLPPADARTIYNSRVDSYIILGCDVAVDANGVQLQKFDEVLRTYARRVLGLSAKAPAHVLYTEMRLMPVKYRRLTLALKYADYMKRLGQDRLARAAFEDSIALRTAAQMGWAHELEASCQQVAVQLFDAEGSLRDLDVVVGDTGKRRRFGCRRCMITVGS